ncbi:MAG: hypothetical protein ACON5A_04995 [Candidatus Comchoanobacterales bacterium]
MRTVHERLIEMVQHYRDDACFRSGAISPVREGHLQFLIKLKETTHSESMLLTRLKEFTKHMPIKSRWYTLWLVSYKSLLQQYVQMVIDEYDLDRLRSKLREDQLNLTSLLAKKHNDYQCKIKHNQQRIELKYQELVQNKDNEIAQLKKSLEKYHDENQLLRQQYARVLDELLHLKQQSMLLPKVQQNLPLHGMTVEPLMIMDHKNSVV